MKKCDACDACVTLQNAASVTATGHGRRGLAGLCDAVTLYLINYTCTRVHMRAYTHAYRVSELKQASQRHKGLQARAGAVCSVPLGFGS